MALFAWGYNPCKWSYQPIYLYLVTGPTLYCRTFFDFKKENGSEQFLGCVGSRSVVLSSCTAEACRSNGQWAMAIQVLLPVSW